MSKLFSIVFSGLLLVGCGGSSDNVKVVPEITPADQIKLNDQHQAMKKASEATTAGANK